ncbi:MAG: LPS-assembly protein LptD [Chitinophagaceae bacterium]|nr:LPS-assembly protein LptD [Chitinophagaceae bacterium]
MNANKGKVKYISASIALGLVIAVTAMAADKLHGSVNFTNSFYNTLTADTPPVPKKPRPLPKKQKNIPAVDSASSTGLPVSAVTDTTIASRQKDSFIVVRDTLKLKYSKDSLDAPIYYHADDSMVMDVPANKITLYGTSTTAKYADNELTAPGITFDQKNNLITASFKKDSTGKVIASPTFKQGDLITVSDSISFSPKSGKGLTKGTYTQQGEMFVYSERIKKIDTTSFYAYKARITTCNLDTPHFAFVSKKIKFINKKFAVTGPVHPEFEGVPLPIVLPFGIYPLAVSPRYYKRYRYSGNFNIDIQRLKINFKGDPDYSVNKSFKIRWSHSMDSKARPGVTFTANVDAGSNSFNLNTPNNPVLNFSNQLQSSISYSKVWKDKPFNINILANHNQNSVSKQISIMLPSVNFNVNTLYPFRRKEAAGTLKWYENIGVALNTSFANQTNFYDDTANAAKDIRPILTQIKQNMIWGARHSVPISLSLPPLGALQVSPSVSYSETWFQKKTVYSWDAANKKLDTSLNKGFYSAREMSFGLGISTRIFGMFGFSKNSKIQAIRHEIRPSMSISYKPDMNGKYFYKSQVDTNGNFRQFNVYENNLNSPFGPGKFGGIGFGIDNNIQMKVRDKKDTSADATKKITLIDGFSINGGYNFLIDSFQLTNLSLSARTNLFDKINITFGGSLDPYQYDTIGNRINRLVWKDKIFTLGRLSNGNVSLSTSFKGGDKTKQATTKKALGRGVNPMTGEQLTEEQEEAAYISNNPADFADFSIPWSVNFGFSFRFSQAFNRPLKKFKTSYYSDANFGGSVRLTEKWQIGFNGSYNFTTSDLGLISFSIAREMHCWQMAITIYPVGDRKFFSLIISPKSALLRDIKVNRTRYFYDLPSK